MYEEKKRKHDKQSYVVGQFLVAPFIAPHFIGNKFIPQVHSKIIAPFIHHWIMYWNLPEQTTSLRSPSPQLRYHGIRQVRWSVLLWQMEHDAAGNHHGICIHV